MRNYDRLHGTLTVRESVDKRSRRKTTKTDSSQRTVTLPRFVLDAIDEHLATFVGGDPDGPLFPGEAGGIISDGWFQREWRAARGALELDEVHFHDLRHAAGTIATQQGATMREVMARLGHSTTSAAIRYQKAAADRDRTLADRLDDLVSGIRTPANNRRIRARSGRPPREPSRVLRGFFPRALRTSAAVKPKNPLPEQRIPWSTPNGIRTRAATLRGWCPRPLDDGGWSRRIAPEILSLRRTRPLQLLGGEDSNPQCLDQNQVCCQLHHPRR